MPTINQLSLLNKQKNQKKRLQKTPALQKTPQKKATCLRVFKMNPRKPNSAERKVARLQIYATGRLVTAFIPGEGHNLQKYGEVLIRGGRTKDLPGIKYKVIRGKFDIDGVEKRKNGRSKYGTKKVK